MLKSALKNPSAVSRDSEVRRKVRFSQTVEIYSYTPASGVCDEEDGRECEDDSERSDLTLEGTGAGPRQDITEVYEGDLLPEGPEDFHVHKVVYHSYEELFPGINSQDSEIDGAENDHLVYYPSESEAELQEFVVHCVSKLQKEKGDQTVDAKESEQKGILPTEDKNVCELSVENIEQHNKLTEGEIRIDTEMDCTNALLSSSVMLSPPLQDLGIEHLICPQSDKWFWDLDISPLNSTQETDSGSNISSEDTMIMMTSEECEKNEKRIQESLEKFESLKKLKCPETDNAQEMDESLQKTHDSSTKCLLHGNPGVDESTVTELSDTVAEMSVELSDFCAISSNSSVLQDSCGNVHSAGESKVKSTSVESLEAEEYENGKDAEECTVCGEDGPIELSSNSSISLDDSLTLVRIPQDVREWKIELKESKLCLESSNADAVNSFESLKCNNKVEFEECTTSISLPDCKSDELESFVQECTERIERIKKRYSISEKSLWTPRRGIRPRFGSTAQILQQMQSNDRSSVPNNHYSWPYYDSVCSESGNSYLLSSPTGSLLQNCDYPSKSFIEPEAYFESSSSETGETWTESTVHRSCSNCDLKTDVSSDFLPPKSPPFPERGVPEGSSPPPTSTESLRETKNQNEPLSTSSDSVIYYSMKV